jgi:hypothetical protein
VAVRFLKDLTTALNKSKLNPDEKEQIKNKAKTAVHAIVAYTNWLKDLENKTPRSFRLGSKLYSEKFDLIFNRVTALTTIFKRQSIIKRTTRKNVSISG